MSKIIAAFLLMLCATVIAVALRAAIARPQPALVVPHCLTAKPYSFGVEKWFLPCSDLDVYYDA